ncbi:MAG: hypothetical protein F6J93_23615 [Oscillatoria sp. SIO1A7]|nr:hypothetical protein [Oscillatoria sp. SIO1A7]
MLSPLRLQSILKNPKSKKHTRRLPPTPQAMPKGDRSGLQARKSCRLGE